MLPVVNVVLTPLALGFGGPMDVAIVAGVVLVLFGGSKLPGLFKGMGEGLREFKKATREEDPPAAPTPAAPAPTVKDEEK